MLIQDTASPPRIASSVADAPSPEPTQCELRVLLDEADRTPLPARLAPPVAKRGAQTTDEGNAGVHWLGLSHPNPSGEAFCDLLQIPRDKWRVGEYGMRHYPRCLFLGAIRVGYGGPDRNGSHMEMSGSACEEIEAMPWFTTWAAFFAKALAMDCTVTRLDLYKDVRDGSVTVEELERKWKAGEVTSRAEDARCYMTLPKGCGEGHAGATLGVGSRKSGTYLRIYDKAKERASKDSSRAQPLGECEQWVRIEVELKDERAMLVLREIAEKGWFPTTVGSVINAHTEFKSASAEGKNRYRAQAWAPWRRAMGAAEKLRRSVAKVRVTIAQAERNLDRQYGPTIAALLAHYEGTTQWVKTMAARNYHRINESLKEALDQEDQEWARHGWA